MKTIKELREKKGLSKYRVAKMIGKSPTFVAQLESGTRNATSDTLAKLAQVLGNKEKIFASAKKIEPEIENILDERAVISFLRKISRLTVKQRRERLKELEMGI